MPAIDNLFGGGAIHIADRNKKNPVTTLCGQALDKDTIRFFESVENFDQSTCKVCRKSYFDEDWTGKSDDTQSSEITQRPQPAANQGDRVRITVDTKIEPSENARNTLFGSLSPVTNKHDKPEEEKSDGG